MNEAEFKQMKARLQVVEEYLENHLMSANDKRFPDEEQFSVFFRNELNNAMYNDFPVENVKVNEAFKTTKKPKKSKALSPKPKKLKLKGDVSYELEAFIYKDNKDPGIDINAMYVQLDEIINSDPSNARKLANWLLDWADWAEIVRKKK
jgi:hypothetical protein